MSKSHMSRFKYASIDSFHLLCIVNFSQSLVYELENDVFTIKTHMI